MAHLQALIFDVDGTLADTERDGHRLAFNRAFAASGLDWDWPVELYGELLAIAGGKERIQFYLEQYRPDFQYPTNRATFIAGLHQAKTTHYKQLLQEGKIPLRPGVKRLLKEAQEQGIRLAIATTSAPENAIALLQTTLGQDSPDWFDVIAAGDIVPAKKPAPDIYFYVLEKMGWESTACLVIEDSHHGLTAATQAGLNTIVTTNDYTQGQDFSEALLVIDQLGEPEQPFQVIQGDVGNATHCNLELMRSLHLNATQCSKSF